MRYAACVLLIRPTDGKVLAVSRKHDLDDFGLPGGKSEPGETPAETAARELEEETGFVVDPSELRLVYTAPGRSGQPVHTFHAAYNAVQARVATTPEEVGRVAWVTWNVLKNGSFGKYNADLRAVIESLGQRHNPKEAPEFARVRSCWKHCLQRAGKIFPEIMSLRLISDPEAGAQAYDGRPSDAARQFGYFDPDSFTIGVAPDLAEQPRTRIEGILRHEIGHAVDFAYPPREIEKVFGEPKGTIRTLKPEHRADRIATLIWDSPIRYDRDTVQTTGPGGARPRHLPE